MSRPKNLKRSFREVGDIGALAAVALLAGHSASSAAEPDAAARQVQQTQADRTKHVYRKADESRYLTMRDGVRVALSLWYPPGRKAGDKHPAMLVLTRYGRAGVVAGEPISPWLAQGYVLVGVDVRGTTSSFGPRTVELGPDELADTPEIIAHLAAQPWSDGKVLTTGVSYLADTADLSTSLEAPALKGAIVRHADYDATAHLFQPGGVAVRWILETFHAFTAPMDTGVAPDHVPPLNCPARAQDCALLAPVLTPVDGDEDFTLLRQAISGRKRWLSTDYDQVEFRDDRALNGFTMLDFSPVRQNAGVRAQAKPAQYWGSWHDAGTAESALARRRSTGAPMDIWITANDHPELLGTDPFFPGDSTAYPSADEQHKIWQAFGQKVLAGQPIEPMIHYAVLGTRSFKTTKAWPPEGVVQTRFVFGADGKLARSGAKPGSVARDMDLAASSGPANRWTANLGVTSNYQDRREVSAKLPNFTTKAFTRDMEVAGYPVVRLRMASASRDPAVFAYLEDVAPDGRVTYLTEGILRVVNRKPADPAKLPYDQGPAPHSLMRADALPVTSGKVETVEFAMFPIAAKIAKGHALRVSIAAADASVFRTYSNGGPERFDIKAGAGASHIDIPLKAWTED